MYLLLTLTIIFLPGKHLTSRLVSSTSTFLVLVHNQLLSQHVTNLTIIRIQLSLTMERKPWRRIVYADVEARDVIVEWNVLSG